MPRCNGPSRGRLTTPRPRSGGLGDEASISALNAIYQFVAYFNTGLVRWPRAPGRGSPGSICRIDTRMDRYWRRMSERMIARLFAAAAIQRRCTPTGRARVRDEGGKPRRKARIGTSELLSSSAEPPTFELP